MKYSSGCVCCQEAISTGCWLERFKCILCTYVLPVCLLHTWYPLNKKLITDHCVNLFICTAAAATEAAATTTSKQYRVSTLLDIRTPS